MRALDIWLPAWLGRRQSDTVGGIRHVLLCVCDHFEPFHEASKKEALKRVQDWHKGLTEIARGFRDSNDTPARHTFFYPIEQYDADVINEIASICHETGAETELHLHHDKDTQENLTASLLLGIERLSSHGLLSRDSSGRLRYGFIHGNWALDHSHPRGRHCGVTNELQVLLDTGCYADFTMPSAPSRTQTHTINSLYYATPTTSPKSHDRGRRAKVGSEAHESKPMRELLLIQGPLALNTVRRKWGILPRIENSDLTEANPPTLQRLKLWMECNVTVEGRPEWLFVKLHTHGAKPENSGMLLGETMRAFHRSLAEKAESETEFRYHYVSAREMANILHAAEAGRTGDPGQYRDFCYRKDPATAPEVSA